jgi:hypothetical protein
MHPTKRIWVLHMTKYFLTRCSFLVNMQIYQVLTGRFGIIWFVYFLLINNIGQTYLNSCMFWQIGLYIMYSIFINLNCIHLTRIGKINPIWWCNLSYKSVTSHKVMAFLMNSFLLSTTDNNKLSRLYMI